MNYGSPYSPSYAPQAQQAYYPQYAQAPLAQVYPQDYAAMVATGQVVPPPAGPNPSPLTAAFWQESTFGVPRWGLAAGTAALLGIGLAWRAGVFGGKSRGGSSTTRRRTSHRVSMGPARDPERRVPAFAARTSHTSTGGRPNPFAMSTSHDPARGRSKKHKGGGRKRRAGKRRGK